MALQLNLNLNVCLAWLSHNGGVRMGEWADNAYLKFFGTNADPERKNEELELIAHHKLVAGGERRWKELANFIKAETAAFNAKTRPDFFTVTEYDYGTRIEVVAPMATLK